MTTQWTLVTGGAKRIGAQIAKKLAESKIPIVIHYNTSVDEAKTLQKELQRKTEVATIQGSFTTIQSTKDFLKRYKNEFPQTKNLIHNVGSYLIQSFQETTIDDASNIFQTNFFSPFLLTQELLPSIIQEKGAIITLGVSGLVGAKAMVKAPLYFAAKQALLSLTKSLAKELAHHGVRVNMVSPGLLDISVDLEENPNLAKQVPMNHLGKTVDVAGLIHFLLTDDSSYITGQNIEVAGGFNL